jgi:hypothetical protein
LYFGIGFLVISIIIALDFFLDDASRSLRLSAEGIKKCNLFGRVIRLRRYDELKTVFIKRFALPFGIGLNCIVLCFAEEKEIPRFVPNAKKDANYILVHYNVKKYENIKKYIQLYGGRDFDDRIKSIGEQN